MGYLSTFSKDERVNQIKNDLINSRDFVNIFLGYTSNKSDEEKKILFNTLIENISNQIVDSNLVA